ncbi:hypothetical protein C8R46DRAFT_447512 [Mycena filopes]|nr:hypothetical protein C8R46DRAFT_447512 [Mycena filopes]
MVFLLSALFNHIKPGFYEVFKPAYYSACSSLLLRMFCDISLFVRGRSRSVLCPPENYENLGFFREPMWEVPACQLDMRCRTSLSRKNPRNGVYVYLFLSKQRRHAVKLLWRICTSFGLYLLWSGTRFLPQAARARTHPLEMKSTLRLDSQQRAPADASSYGYRTECLEGRVLMNFRRRRDRTQHGKSATAATADFLSGFFPGRDLDRTRKELTAYSFGHGRFLEIHFQPNLARMGRLEGVVA